jgi:hypothetical protein
LRLIETYRIVVFIPAEDVERLLSAVRRVTDLRYGNYLGVSWTSTDGEERYTPVEGASPSVGTIGKEEVVRVTRVEFSIPRNRQVLERVVLEAIYPTHRWEEPVITVAETLDIHRR